MRQLHVDNHYVPQLYLKQWASDGKIQTYRLLVAHRNVPAWRSHSPASIAYHQHLYTSSRNGAENDDLERWLDSEFEAPAERPLHLATSDSRLDKEDWRKLVRFAVAQDVRTPARLRQFLARQSELLPSMLDAAVQRTATRLSDHDAAHFVPQARDGGFPLRTTIEPAPDGSGSVLRAETIIGRSLWHYSMRHLLTEIISKIPMTGWTILKPAHGHSWPTSDSPLIRANYWSENKYNFDGGWGTPRGDVLLPLSPNHLLYRCGGVRTFTRGCRLDISTTQRIIRLIVEHADRYVFARDAFAIDRIRNRVVDPHWLQHERMAWEAWHFSQLQAEQGYSFG